jgi:two-component system cell cycle response regulator
MENRCESRRRVLWAGLIFVPQTHSTIDCSIKDLSETGARISVRSDTIIPNKFLLIDITNRAAYEVRCVRRDARVLGLKMLRSISLTERSSVEANQLRRLLVERLSR